LTLRLVGFTKRGTAVLFEAFVATGSNACMTTGGDAFGTIAESPHAGFDALVDVESLGIVVVPATVRPRDAVPWFSSARGIALVIRGRTWFCAAAGTAASRKGKARVRVFMATLNPLN
jgi:hypothetical protein